MDREQQESMQLLIIVLNREEYFTPLTTLLVEAGVSGATILDSRGLGQFLAYDVPIFAGLRKFIGEPKSISQTILAVLDSTTFIRFKELLVEEGIDFTKPGVGIIITLPINEVIRSIDKPE
jgi:nitrogen regulatory protein P-II 1